MRKGILIKMDTTEGEKRKPWNDAIKYGFYYLPSEVCKDIIINENLSGVHSSQAVKRIRSRINCMKEELGEIIPALGCVDQDIINYYSGELAESIVNAAGNGKGVDIAIGYPKVLVISVN